MLRTQGRMFVVVGAMASLVFLYGAAPPVPSNRQIARWIAELDSDKFTARENASRQLWLAGEAAEVALEKALKSSDPEVVRRARELLDKFHWGIYPNTPADIVALIRAYQSGEGNARRDPLEKLFESGDAGLRAIRKIVRVEKEEIQRSLLRELLANKLKAVFLQAAIEEKHQKYEQLLDLGHEGQLIPLHQYAAYWLLRGKISERIAHFRAAPREHPDDQWTIQTLAYLHRANGNLVEARKAAEKAGDADLLEGILYEMADWKTLAARPLKMEKVKHQGMNKYGIERMLASQWGFRAAYTRLSGKDKDFEKAISELRIRIEAVHEENGKGVREVPSFVAVKAMLLNDRTADGLAMLAKTKRDTVLFDLLHARLDFRKALDLPETPRPASSSGPGDLEFFKARTLAFLGEKEEAEKRFARFGEQIKDNADSSWVITLLQQEHRAGLTDLAFAHCAKALQEVHSKNPARACTLAALLFPEQAATAEVWWTVLREKHKEESTESVLKRLRALMEGKTAAKDVKAWIEEAERAIAQSLNIAVERQALAETAVKAGLEDVAVALLLKADSRDALLRLGDLLAAKKQWTKAAERYRQAWKKELLMEKERAVGMRPRALIGRVPYDPLSLYLAGDALIRAGQEKEGKKLVEQSHAIPLADDERRVDFIHALIKRRQREAAQREADLLLRVSEPSSNYRTEGMWHRARSALKRKDYLQAAEGFEQSMLRCLSDIWIYRSTAHYVNVPAHVHQMRAQGLLAAGKLNAALQQASLALDASPGYVNVPIELVPELERLGHKKEAAALYARCHTAYEKVCRDYPRCAWAHNAAAWMAACCRRDLDKALEHAEKAVALAPTNAAYLDTLAEVHFQRGDKDKAIASQKRAIELDPKKPYYRKQLKRREAGDPNAERPPENEE